MNKKAQIGETMTWIVATIVIMIILLFSIFVSGLVGIGGKKDFSSQDSQEDFVAKKSIYLFMEKESNLNLIFDSVENGNYALLETKIEKLFEGFTYPYYPYWHFKVKVNDKEKFEMGNSLKGPGGKGFIDTYFNYFEYINNGKKIKIIFSKEI